MRAPVNGRVITRKPLRAFAAFEEFHTAESGDILTLEGSNIHPDRYHSLLIGKYFPYAFATKQGAVTLASLTFANKPAYTLLEGLSKGVLELYEFSFGPFPFKGISILEARGRGWGHAPPAMVFASGEIFNSLRDDETQMFSRGANERFAHELAHEYYGHLVQMNGPDAWLEEAVAEYMAGFFLSRSRNKNDLKYLYEFWYNRSKGSADKASLYSVQLLDGRDAYTYHWDLVYCKGPAVIQAIRDKTGDKMFWTALRSFLRSFPYQAVTTQDFIGLLNYLTKEDWQPFFDRYVYGKGMPPRSEKIQRAAVTTRIAFLRAVNVAGHATIKMDALQRVFKIEGCNNIKTYIQRGNVLFDAPKRGRGSLQKQNPVHALRSD